MGKKKKKLAKKIGEELKKKTCSSKTSEFVKGFLRHLELFKEKGWFNLYPMKQAENQCQPAVTCESAGYNSITMAKQFFC